MSDIADLQKRVKIFCTAREWNLIDTPKDMAISLSLEAAEVLEHFQWKNDTEVAEHLVTHKEEVGEELSDVLYWVLRMAGQFDIDITDAFQKKMTKNEQKYPVEKARGNHKKYTEHIEN